MERNKEEATRAMKKTERKLIEKDYNGAKKFLRQAHKLYPNLDADDVTVKKQYKKLALLLHPDKNKFEGAKKAFELVSDAWCLLSDHSKRKTYDQQRKYKEEKQKRDASCVSSETTKDAKQAKEKMKRWFNQEWVAARASAEEAERRFKNQMKRPNENSTEEAERLFKRPVMAIVNENFTSEAERLFKNPMKAADANSTSEAERLFGKPWRCVN